MKDGIIKTRGGNVPPFDLCERTFQYALRVLKLCTHLDEKPGIGRALSWQLLRSGTSIGANVEEGQAGQSRADFISKYSIARKESHETSYWLRLITASGVSDHPDVSQLINEAEQLKKILTSIIKKAKNQ